MEVALYSLQVGRGKHYFGMLLSIELFETVFFPFMSFKQPQFVRILNFKTLELLL